MNAVYAIFTQLHKLRSLRRSFLHFHFISAVHIWFISYIINTLFFHGDIWTHNWPAPQRQWLHSSVGRASHRYREVTGSNPVEVLNFFFSGFFTQLQKLRPLRRSFLHFHEIGLMKCSFQYYKEVQPLVLPNQTWMALKEFSLEFADNCETRGHISVFKPY